MRKHVFAVLALTAVGCSSNVDTQGPEPSEAPVAATAAQTRSFEKLTLETNRKWTWLQHPSLKTPLHVSADRNGAPILRDRSKVVEVTHAFLTQYRDLFKMTDPARELTVKRTRTDALGMTHARFQQTVKGVPVAGAELIAHYDAAGRLTSIDANYVPDVDLDVTPRLTPSIATDLAKRDVLDNASDVTEDDLEIGEPKLVVYAAVATGADVTPTLAYEVKTRAMVGKEPAIWVSTFDAKTGALIHRYNNFQTVEGSGAGVLGDAKKFQVTQGGGGYVMTDSSRGVSIQTFTAKNQQVRPSAGATNVTSTVLTTWDQTSVGAGAAVDAHTYAGVVFDYYKTTHARNAINGKGAAMLSTAHFGQNYDNAGWDGTGMLYGDGGTVFRPLSAGLDVVAHEFTHGVTENESDLTYEGQSGALNESVSDIFGCFIEHVAKPDATKNWILGEAIAKNGAIRNMTNPAAGKQPAHMTKFVNTQQDNGGVHINSGIPNNAAYLMTMGGKNPVSGVEVAFGIGWEKSEKLWYRINTQYLISSSNFAQAAAASAQAAKDVGLTENEQNIVACAWKAVGVTSGTCGTIVNPQGTTPGTDGEGGNGDGTGTAPGDGTSGTGDEGADGTTAAKPKKKTVTTESSGCSVSQTGSNGGGTAVLAGLAAVAVVLAGRRRRQR